MPAFDLSGMYGELARSIPGYGNVAKGQADTQQLMSDRLAYEAKKEELEAARGLRKLFEQNPNAGIEEVARYSPAFAQDLMKSRLLMQKEMLGMKETEQKMQKGQKEMAAIDQQTIANTFGPIAEQALISGDIEKYKRNIGQAASDLKARGIQLPMSFDPSQHTPDIVLRNATGFGYKSPLVEQQMRIAGEQQMRQLPPGMSAEQAYGGVSMTPYGPMQIPPIRGLGQPMQQPMQPQTQMRPAQVPEGYQRATAEDLPMLQQAYDQATDLNEKQKIGALLNQLQKQTGAGLSQSQFVTPEQIPALKAEEARAKKEAELAAEEESMSRKATNAYDMLPSPDRIRNLIKGSISGDAEYWANRLGGVVGKSLEAGDLTGALEVIQGQMADTVAMFPGAQSDKELEARMKTIGNPSGKISADTRLKAFDEWQERMQKYAAQHADYDDIKLVDMVREKKLTADQALQIRNRRMSRSR